MLAANSKQTHVTKTPAKVQLRVHCNTIVADGVKALHKKRSRHRRRFAFLAQPRPLLLPCTPAQPAARAGRLSSSNSALWVLGPRGTGSPMPACLTSHVPHAMCCLSIGAKSRPCKCGATRKSSTIRRRAPGQRARTARGSCPSAARTLRRSTASYRAPCAAGRHKNPRN